MNNTNLDRQAGYTLIELVVVIGLTVLLLITVVSLFFTSLTAGGKTSSAVYTKQVGDYTMSRIQFALRNAHKIVPNSNGDICTSGMASIAVENTDLGVTEFLGETAAGVNHIASNSGLFLTPDDVSVVAGPQFDCSPSTYGTSRYDGSAPTVTVSFTLRKGNMGVDKTRDIVEIPFQSQITLRNF
ncbi:MAG TPA: type II secretion system protein [Patescibacteria group bacterium]|nr:type II secretion system protein [Patescibacteria group bacterium]